MAGSGLFDFSDGRRRRAVLRYRSLVRLDHGSERRHLLPLAQSHYDHALRRPAETLDVPDGDPDHGAAVRDQHHLVVVAYHAGTDQMPSGLGQLHGLHAQAAATLARIVGELGPLAVAVLGHDEQVALVDADHVGRDHLVLLAQAHPLHAGGVTAHRPRLLLAEADRLALARDHQDVVLARRMANRDELVALAHLDRDDPVRLQRRVVGRELGLLHDAVLRREDEVLRLLEVAGLDHGAYLLVLSEREQVLDRPALRLARAERKLVHLQPVDLADVREEEDVVVRRGDEQVLDVVVLLQVHAHHALATAALLAVRGHREPLDVVRARDRDHHVFFRDQVLELELALGGDDLRAPVIVLAVDLLDLEQLLPDEAIDPRLVAEDRAQLADPLDEVLVLVLDPLALERGQRAEPEVEDRLRLDLGQLELFHQARARGVRVGCFPDERDHRVEVVERDQVALEDVRARLGLAQLVLRPAGDDFALEVEVMAEQVAEGERARNAVDERHRVVAERRLQRRVLVELVQDDLGNRLALELDLDPHPGLVGQVLDVRDLGDDLVVDEVGDLLDHAGVAALLHGEWQLVDDDRRLAAAQLLDVRAGAHDDSPATRAVRLADPFAAEDDAAGREVRTLDVLGQPVDVDRRVVDHRDERVGDLAQVVRRDVRRHADRDSGGAVDEKVRETGRKDVRLAA